MNKCVAMIAIFGFKDITHSHYITLHITQCGFSFMYMLLLIGGEYHQNSWSNVKMVIFTNFGLDQASNSSKYWAMANKNILHCHLSSR